MSKVHKSKCAQCGKKENHCDCERSPSGGSPGLGARLLGTTATLVVVAALTLTVFLVVHAVAGKGESVDDQLRAVPDYLRSVLARVR